MAGIYAASISKGAALVQETRTILSVWNPGIGDKDLIEAVNQTGRLGAKSSYRLYDIVTRVFLPRFAKGEAMPAQTLQSLIGRHLPVESLQDLILLCAARQDRLLRDFVVEVFWSAVLLGRNRFRIEDATSFIDLAHSDGRIDPPWSENTRIKIARSLVRVLVDTGFLESRVASGARALTRQQVGDLTVATLAHLLRAEGRGPQEISDSPDWLVYGMSADSVPLRLHSLPSKFGITCQIAGTVVGLTFAFDSPMEMIAHVA